MKKELHAKYNSTCDHETARRMNRFFDELRAKGFFGRDLYGKDEPVAVIDFREAAWKELEEIIGRSLIMERIEIAVCRSLGAGATTRFEWELRCVDQLENLYIFVKKAAAPKCHGCGERAARKGSFFCSIRCAAAWAEGIVKIQKANEHFEKRQAAKGDAA